MPSGKVESNEKKEDALKREIFEETGIKIFDVEETLIVHKDEYKLEKKDILEITYKIILNDLSPEIRLSDEHSEYRWIERSNISEYFSNKNDRIYKRLLYLVT